MGIGFQELLIILVIVVVVFGTKKLRGMGGDLGAAIQSFRKAMNESADSGTDANQKLDQPGDDSSSGPKT